MSERLIQIDPNNLSHIELIDEYEKECGYSTPIGTITDKNRNNNDICIELVLEDKKKVKDICHIQGFKDIKQCTLTFASKNIKKRKMISLATNYALEVLGMEEVFINANKNDKNMLEYLLKNDYECLGDESGGIMFLKEKN